MKKNIRMYYHFILISFKTLLVYRANLFNHILSSLAWGSFVFITMFYLTRNITSIFGWSREDIFLLAAMYNFILGLYSVIFSSGLNALSDIIFYGKLDMYLLKPLDSQFHVSLRQVNLSSLPRPVLGLIVTIYLGIQDHVHVSIASLSIVAILIVAAFIFLYSVWFLVLTLLIWFPRLDNLIYLLFSISGMGKYSKTVLKPFSGTFIFILILPFFLTASLPTLQLLGRASTSEEVLFCVLSVILFMISRAFWNYALRFYSGGSV